MDEGADEARVTPAADRLRRFGMAGLLWLACATAAGLPMSHARADDAPAGAAESSPVGHAAAEAGGGGHGDPIAPVLISVLVIILAARLGGHVFETMGQPAVLGELVVGVILGNLSLIGVDLFEFLKVDYTQHHLVDILDFQSFAGVTIDHLARIGVILLLFNVGLESSIAQMQKVGASALVVAVVGVVVPTALGWGCGAVLLPDHPWPVHMFIGATLCATSVGITARVLQDLKRSRTTEAQIVLGAAVIDDVLGLIVLALTQGIIVSMGAAAAGEASGFNSMELVTIIGKAVGFLVGAFLLGRFLNRPLFKVASALRGQGLLLVTALSVCFLFAWAADQAGLATIVGAFAAGLILERVHYREFVAEEGEHGLEEAIAPLVNLLVPIFFVMMGLRVDLRSFGDLGVLGLAGALTVAAIIGKQVCGLGVLQPGVDRLTVGIGMIPRGEVGLIFANIGLGLTLNGEKIVDNNIYSALVVMVMVTTLVTPPLLKWSFNRKSKAEMVNG